MLNSLVGKPASVGPWRVCVVSVCVRGAYAAGHSLLNSLALKCLGAWCGWCTPGGCAAGADPWYSVAVYRDAPPPYVEPYQSRTRQHRSRTHPAEARPYTCSTTYKNIALGSNRAGLRLRCVLLPASWSIKWGTPFLIFAVIINVLVY